jgi:hypothetical protein
VTLAGRQAREHITGGAVGQRDAFRLVAQYDQGIPTEVDTVDELGAVLSRAEQG